MKTWHLRRGRNVSRIDFGWCIFENVKELLLSVFLHAWARAYIRNLHSCIRNSVLVCAGMLLRLYVHGNGLAYAGSCLHAWALTRLCETSRKSLTLPIFTSFSYVSLQFAILTHIFVIFAPEYHCILFFSLHSCIKTSYFPNSAWIRNLMSSFFLFAVIIPLCW